MDNATSIVPSGGVGTIRGDWMQYSMRGGNVVLNITNAGLITTGGDVDLDGFIEDLQTLPADATHGLTIMTARDLTVNHAIQSQNPDTGNSLPINLIAGWDGSTPFDAATFDAVNVNAASPTLFGNNEGSVSIGDGSQAFGVTIGSRSAATRVYGHDLNITGGTDNGVFAQFGYHRSNAGTDFMINGPLTASLRNDITITSGNSTDAYALLGHVGTDLADDNTPEATVNAPITINAGNNLNLSANAVVAYSQLGHGGADALGDFTGDITITTVNDINLMSDNSILAYTQLGHGGANANGNHSGNITVSTTNDLNFTSGDEISSYSQLGHGGLNANGNLAGNILFSDINNLSFQGGNALNSYSQLGHGSATFGSNVQSSGTRQGVITILGSGELSVIDGNTPETNANYAWIGHGSIDTAANTYTNAGLTLAIDRLDNASSALASGEQGTLSTDWLLHNLRGGGVILNIVDAGLDLNPSTAILGTLSSPNQLLVQVNTNLVFNDGLALTNTGTGNMIFFANENFHNDTGGTAPITINGRWVVYSTNADNNRQDLEITNRDFAEDNITFSFIDPFPAALPAGDGLVYSDSVNCIDGIVTRYTGTGWNNGVPGQDDRAIMTVDYDTNIVDNLDVCSCEILEGRTLTVGDNSFLRTQYDITVTGILQVSNAGSVVQVADDALTINTGNIAVAKTTPFLQPRDFIVLSSPMTTETNGGVFGNADRVFRILSENFTPNTDPALDGVVANFLDDNGDYLDNLELDNPNLDGDAVGLDNILNPAEGLLVFPQAVTDVGATPFAHTYTQGTLNSGTIVAPIIYNGPNTENNFNLLGNPYASAIDTDALIANNTTINQVYFWEHITPPDENLPGFNTLNFSMDDVSVRNLTMGVAAVNDPDNTNTPGQFMASGQGFGILADQTASGTDVTFTNALRATGNNGTPRSPQQDNRLWLRLDSETYTLQSRTGIGFLPQASVAFDSGYDSERLNTTINLFSTLETGEQLVINGRETFDPSMQIPLGFSTIIPESETYTISIDLLEGSELTQTDIFLIDHLEGTITNLKEASYTFASNETLQADRFMLVFEDLALNVDDNSLDQNISLYPNPASNQLTINSGDIVLQEAVIYDITGRALQTLSLQTTNTQLNIQHLKAGNYVLQLIDNNGNSITKRFIKR